MSTDRFVPFGAVVPTREQIGEALRRFIGPLGTVEWHDETHRFYATLPGEPTRAWDGPLDFPDARFSAVDSRQFEVFIADDNIDVITRWADDATDALAYGFARQCVFAFGNIPGAKAWGWFNEVTA